MIIGSYGIGSRHTPGRSDQMVYAASQLKEMGLILRSGGADGADMALKEACRTRTQGDPLPWRDSWAIKSSLRIAKKL